METKDIIVYGAEVICSSCAGAPSSEETYTWLQAAIGRKYPDRTFHYQYVDIFDGSSATPEQKEFAQNIIDEGYFWPIVVINNEIVAEGNPNLLEIYRAIEQ